MRQPPDDKRASDFTASVRRFRLGRTTLVSPVAVGCALGATVYFVVLVGVQLGKPLIYDDANFALAARAVADSGVPFGNQGWMSDRGDFSQQAQWALWHPPLYVYLLGIIAKLGGTSGAALRIVGLLGGVATAGLTFILAHDLCAGTGQRKVQAGAIAVACTVVSPLFVQSALILDIDFTLLLPMTLLFLVGYLRLEGGGRWPILVPLVALMLWSKMTNPLPLLAVVVAWQLVRGEFARGLRQGAVLALGGSALFGITWVVVGTWLGFPLDMPFGVNLAQLRDSAEVARRAYTGPEEFIAGLQPTLAWMGPGAALLGLTAAGLRSGQLAGSWRIQRVDLVLGLAAALVLGYVNKSAGWFPKYQVALIPLLCAAGAPIAALTFQKRPIACLAVSAVGAMLVAILALYQIGDSWALGRSWQIPGEAALLLLAAVGASFVFGALLRLPALGVVALAAVAVGWSVGVDVDQARADYSTTYWYGTRGTLAASDWVNAHLPPGALYVAAKEVALQSQRGDYLDEDTLLYYLDSGRGFATTWSGMSVEAVVAWDRDPSIRNILAANLPRVGYQQDLRLEDYAIYLPAPR